MTRPIIALAVLVSASATVNAQSGWHKKCEKTATSENVCLTFHQRQAPARARRKAQAGRNLVSGGQGRRSGS